MWRRLRIYSVSPIPMPSAPEPARPAADVAGSAPRPPTASITAASTPRNAIAKMQRNAEITAAGTLADFEPIKMLLSAHKNADPSAAASPTSHSAQPSGPARFQRTSDGTMTDGAGHRGRMVLPPPPTPRSERTQP